MDPHRHTPLEPSNLTSRRRFLALSGTAIASTLAGCTDTPSDIRSRTLDPETNEEDDATYLKFLDGEDRIAVVSVLERWTQNDRPPYPIRTHVWHADGMRLESLRYEFHPSGTGHPPEFYLGRPDGYPWEPIEFSRGENSEVTVLEIPDLGFQGRGSVSLDFLVEPWRDDEFELRLDVNATVSSERFFGRTYHLEGLLTRTLPGYDFFE